MACRSSPKDPLLGCGGRAQAFCSLVPLAPCSLGLALPRTPGCGPPGQATGHPRITGAEWQATGHPRITGAGWITPGQPGERAQPAPPLPLQRSLISQLVGWAQPLPRPGRTSRGPRPPHGEAGTTGLAPKTGWPAEAGAWGPSAHSPLPGHSAGCREESQGSGNAGLPLLPGPRGKGHN